MDKDTFSKRLVEPRQSKGISARNMNLSIGQSAGYINNNIKNGISFPPMTVFFYICDFLEISPKEFFDAEIKNPTKARELSFAANKLNNEQLNHLIAIANGLH